MSVCIICIAGDSCPTISSYILALFVYIPSDKERTARFSHANSTPALPNQPMSSMDIEEAEQDEGIEEGEGPVTMEMDQQPPVR